MGLLDEAIREHLELKRRRGADPSAIAREEREALAPVFPDESAAGGGDTARDAPEAVGIAPAGRARGGASPCGRPARRALLGGSGDGRAGHAGGDGGRPRGSRRRVSVGSIADGPAPAYAGEPAAEDSLDWEFPGDRERESVPEDIPGQERLSFE